MKVRLIVGASHAYACVSGAGYSCDFQLRGGMGAPKALRMSAAELREHAAREIVRAERMEQAADLLEQSK